MEKIFVTIRVRPLSKVESAKGSPWKLGPNTISLCNSTGAPVSGQSYTFDKVFGSESTTLNIYEAHTKDIISSAVQGFNGTVFAYGQTSSGKTYTMRGSPQEPGIIPLAVQEVFSNIQEAEDREFLLRVSYMEIYNEEINDLLAPENRKLQVHENLERGIFVAGLREEIVVSPEQVLDLMTVGETYRHVGETNMNVYSSRSHTIFRMVIESRDRSHDDQIGSATVQACDAVRVSVLNLVDLAGSERVAKTGAEGARLKEGTHINKSLMTLGTVINKLSEGVEKQGGHVPYRDSKLTRILQPALGGNAKTAVICNITPAQVHVDETKGTLFFASRANRVTNCAQVNEIMTDAALLKRQKREIEELRNKLQENHSDHWEEEVLDLRNALLKTELERERMALELQEEKKAQAERERRLKEQEQKIENLSTMVINSAVDDRDNDRRSKKNNRRETWCPRIPFTESESQSTESKRPFLIQPPEIKRPFPQESPGGPFGKLVLPSRRDRLPPLPPPFESLMEEEDIGSPLMEVDENTIVEEFQRIPSDGTTLDSIFKEPPPVRFGERKRRSAEKSMDIDLKQQLGDLQVQYDDLQFEHELKMQEKMLEMEDLKKELACAQSAANKARKLDDNHQQGSEDRRAKSLDGWESDTNLKQLRVQVQNLELEKFYMQKELDSVTEHATIQAASAKAHLEKMQQELEESRNEAANAKVELSHALGQIDQFQKERQVDMDQQAQLIASFNELMFELEATKSSSQYFQVAAVDETHVLKADIRNLQEFVVDVKSLKAVLEKQFATSQQSELAALANEHSTLWNVLQAVQLERDAFCEVSKLAKTDLKSFGEEFSKKSKELEATEGYLDAANQKILCVGNEVAELRSLLSQREEEQQILQQKIRDLEGEALAADSEAEKEKLKERIIELEQSLQKVSQEKASLVCKGEAMHATIQVLEGERDALMETAKQAQADMDRLQGKRRQELKEAQNKLEVSLSETHAAREQLITMRALLSEKTEEQQMLQDKFQTLQQQSTILNRALEEKVESLETRHSMTKQALDEMTQELESSQQNYGVEKAALERKMEELQSCLEVLNQEKSELHQSCERSQLEIQRLCGELDSQGRMLAEAKGGFESASAQSAKSEEQMSALQLSLSQQTDELESAKRKVVDLNAEKTAMETCLAGESPKSISSVLVETSLQLSAAEYSLQLKVTELEKMKCSFELLQESRSSLEAELAEAKAYTAALEETLSDAVSALEASSQEKDTLKIDLQKALEESSLKNAKLADLENECAALVDRLASMKVEMEDAKVRWEQEVLDCKASYVVVNREKLGYVEDCQSLRSALVSMKEEREVLKEQNFQAQAELKEFDVEVQRQRQEIEAAERALKIANSGNVSAADIIADHQALLSQKSDEILFLQKKIQDMDIKTSSLEEDLETKVRDLELAKRREDSLTLEYRGAQQQLVSLEVLLSEKNEKIQVLGKDYTNLEAEYSGMREDIASKVAEMEQLALLTTAERAHLVEKNEAALAVLQKVEEEQHGLFMTVEELKEEVKQLKQLLGDSESHLEGAKVKLEIAHAEVHDLQSILADRTSQKEQAEQERDILVEKISVAEKLLKEELEMKTQDVDAVVSKLEEANVEVLNVKEKLKQMEQLLTIKGEEKERVEQEKAALLEASSRLQEIIEVLKRDIHRHELENEEVESKLAAAISEVDDAGKQLNEVHTLMSEYHLERLMLQQKLEELETSKSALEKTIIAREAELTARTEALSEASAKLEAFQQLHHTESSQLRSDIMGLRKELKAAKSAPATLEKERDGLRKDLEKLKTKMGDLEAKLKSTLIEKSKVETEKVNLDREVKQLRQSTALLNKRESIVDKRRESVASGLNKTKLQLSSTEHALQMKNNELEKTAFDLQVLQDNYAKLQADMSETEKTSATLKEKLAEAETAISLLRDEKATAARSIEKIAQELEDALEQRRVTNAQLEALQAEYNTLGQKLQACQVESEEAEASAKAIVLEKHDLAQQLTDAHFEFEEEKAAWASQADVNDAKIQELEQEIVSLTDQVHEVQDAREKAISARDSLQEQVMNLEQALQENVRECLRFQEQLEQAKEDASSLSAVLQEKASKLEHNLESSAQDTAHLKQQVELLNSSLQERLELSKKLEEKIMSDQQQYKALQENYQKLEHLIVQSESNMNAEKESKAELVGEIEQLKEMLDVMRQNGKDLQEQILESKISIQEEVEARTKLLEDRQALAEMVQTHRDRCKLLEEQIFKTDSIMRQESEAKVRLLQEIHELQERLQQSMADSAQQGTFDVNRLELEKRVLQLESDWMNEQRVASEAKKQVDKLQSQLKWSSADLRSLQSELDKADMMTKSLTMELNEIQEALDKASTEKTNLIEQVAELNARISSLQVSNEQQQMQESHQTKEKTAYLVSKCKLERILMATSGRLTNYRLLWQAKEEEIQELYVEHKIVQRNLSVAEKEVKERCTEIENLRRQCQRYEEEIMQFRTSCVEGQDRENKFIEVMQQNNVLLLQLQKAEESIQARREELWKLNDFMKGKEESTAKLQGALENAQSRVVKLERELHLKVEPQTAQKPGGSIVFTTEVNTPIASRQEEDDWKPTDDTDTLYSSNLASRSKVEQLKLQSQSLLRKYKQPWRIQRSPGGSVDQSDADDDHPPPPSTTLHSRHENLTAPIYTWKKPKITGAPSNTELPQLSVSAFSEDRPNASFFTSRSTQRAALVPVTQNKLPVSGLEKRFQALGSQTKLPVQGEYEGESMPSSGSLHTPKEFRFNQRFEKENL